MLTQAQRVAFQDIHHLIPAKSLIMDVGFGKGEFLAALGRNGYRLAGLEATESFVSAGQTSLSRFSPTLIHTNNPASWNGDTPSAVTCFEVLEHVPDPLAFLATMPHGVPTWFSTPNERRWSVRLTGKYEPWDFPPNHLRRFDKATLTDTLRLAGYKRVLVEEMPVAGRELLGPIIARISFGLGLQRNVPEYDQVVNRRGGLSMLVCIAKAITRPGAAVAATALNMRGYKGGNLLAYGVKE